MSDSSSLVTENNTSLSDSEETGELLNNGSGEENVSLETLLEKCPPVPSFLPDQPKDGAKCATTKVPPMFSVPCDASGGPSFSRDTYKRDTALTYLPSKDSPIEEKLLWPLEVC